MLEWGLRGSYDAAERHGGTLCTPVLHSEEELAKQAKKGQDPGDRGALEAKWRKVGESAGSDATAESNSEGGGLALALETWRDWRLISSDSDRRPRGVDLRGKGGNCRQTNRHHPVREFHCKEAENMQGGAWWDKWGLEKAFHRPKEMWDRCVYPDEKGPGEGRQAAGVPFRVGFGEVGDWPQRSSPTQRRRRRATAL